MVAIADIDSRNYRIFRTNLDLDRSEIIYRTLAKLSDDAVKSLTDRQSKQFSLITDKMRPLLSYMADNEVKLSRVDESGESNVEEMIKRDPNIRQFVVTLRKNLKILSEATASMKDVPFNPIFFASEELTNAYLDYRLGLAWEFDHDLVVCLNLEDTRLIDFLMARGQKRILILGGPLENKDLTRYQNGHWDIAKVDSWKWLSEKVGGLPPYLGRPPRKIHMLDVGKEKTSDEEKKEIMIGMVNARNSVWARFNTINRGDSIRVLNNLGKMTIYEQTNVYHKKFKGRSAVIVCPGPSLKKNVDLLKKIKDKVLIICVLHALKELQKRDIVPDLVIHVDPADLKKLHFKKNGQEISYWQDWIEDNDFSEVPHFVVSSYSKPDIFDVPAKNVLWMSPGLPMNSHLPLDIFDYERIGGSVSHTGFDLAIEFGCDSVALIGQDLAVSKTGDVYTSTTNLGSKDEKTKEEIEEERQYVYGNEVEVEGWDGKKVMSNNAFCTFARSYSAFAAGLEESGVKLYNCTEGGMFIDGFDHVKFKDFVKEEVTKSFDKTIGDIFDSNKSTELEKKSTFSKTRKYIGKNSVLAEEINELIKVVIKLGEKDLLLDEEKLSKFNRLQNKVIKKMEKNIFYSLGLQRDIHILQSGLKADDSLRSQIGFHLDFIKVAKNLNDNFRRAFLEQRKSLLH